MKPRIASALVLLVIATGAGPAIAQGQPATAAAPPVNAPAQSATEPSRPAAANPHADDADARGCLDFVANIGVIRCAEKFRTQAAVRHVR